MKKLLLILATAPSLILAGCRASKPTPITPLPTIPLELTTSSKIIHTSTIDTVYIDIPQQTAERTSPAKTSHLETDYALSDARINPDGTLTHTLSNRPTRHPVSVTHTTDTIHSHTSTELPVPVEVPIEVDRPITTWQQ
ncbi:MAG: hypothetical protein K2H35_04320, partial [Muribaculaceae bacterium]|nr:hypothetical protein [Muribaculaceae bacterium]